MMTCTDSPGTSAYDNLVQLAVALRPRWQAPGVKAAIRKALDRVDAFTFADLCFAVAYVCADKDVKTPAPLAHDGPWWPKPTAPTTLSAAASWDQRCSVCSHPQHTCRRLFADDHDYTPNRARPRGVETPAELDQKARAWFAVARQQAAATRNAIAEARQQTARDAAPAVEEEA